MRQLAVVVVGGSLIGLRYWNAIDAVPWPLQLGFVALVTFAVGFATGSRGWLAAVAAFAVGHVLWVLVELRPSPPWAASDVWGWEQWGIFLITLLPTAIGASVLGALGAWVRRAALPARRVPA
jgi:hypothetical protein